MSQHGSWELLLSSHSCGTQRSNSVVRLGSMHLTQWNRLGEGMEGRGSGVQGFRASSVSSSSSHTWWPAGPGESASWKDDFLRPWSETMGG